VKDIKLRIEKFKDGPKWETQSEVEHNQLVNFTCVTYAKMAIMKREKSNGLKWSLWGTPEVALNISEEESPR